MRRYPLIAEAEFQRAIEEMKREKLAERIERELRAREAADRDFLDERLREHRGVLEYAI